MSAPALCRDERALGVEPVQYRAETFALLAEQAFLGNFEVVEEQLAAGKSMPRKISNMHPGSVD